MYKQLRNQIATVIDLTDDEYELFLTFVQFKKLKRKEFLLREGEICRYAYFILKGSLRYFHIADGKEHTGQFFFENSWYTDYNSFLSGYPSKQNIQSMEQSEIVMLPKDALEKLYTLISKFERFGRLMAENAFRGLKQRTEMLTTLDAEERYLNLLEQRPKLIERIPQHYIASYIGIEPQSLSRIRKKLAGNS